jgi:hypothetical protein
LGVAGCGGGGGGDVEQAPEVIATVLKAISAGLHFGVETHVSPGALHDLGLALSESINNGAEIKTTLDRIAASDDPYGEAISQAICIGLGQVAQQPPDTTASPETWDQFLEQEVEILLPDNPVSVIRAKLNQLNTTTSLAEVNPRLAADYYNMCVRSIK